MRRLETERLILRTWNFEDAEDMFAYASTPKVGPMAGWKPHENLEETRGVIEMILTEDEVWALELKENHKVIGSLGLHKSKKAGLEYDRELGYVLSEDYWGQGLAVEAAKRSIQFAFEELQIDTLLVSHFDFNTQSKRVIEKLGFCYQTHIAKCGKRYDGVILNEEVYRMTRQAYFGVIGKMVKVTVDRPMGSFHPEHKDLYYPINYGYIEGTMAPDGEEQDAYILGVDVPVKEFIGKIIEVIHRQDDVEEKWVVASENASFTKEEIMEQVYFQEQYFKSEIIM